MGVKRYLNTWFQLSLTQHCGKTPLLKDIYQKIKIVGLQNERGKKEQS